MGSKLHRNWTMGFNRDKPKVAKENKNKHKLSVKEPQRMLPKLSSEICILIAQ
jgi:hypothetical protein